MTEPRNDEHGEIACSLSAKAAEDQVQEWRDLNRHVTSSEALPDGARIMLPASLEGQIVDLAQREEACCSFLSLVVHKHSSDTVVLEVTSANPKALPVIEALSGIAIPAP